jgi:bis(5'-nucleosidyl)-tetraphosphatase
MARTERSAGVVVWQKRQGKITYLLLDYGRHWDFPKGHVEKSEDDLMAALRELAEETGITEVTLTPGFQHEMAYFFTANGQLIRKSVMFYLAETTMREITLSHEHVGYAFLPFDEAMKRLTYDNAKEMLRLANKELDGQASHGAG